MQRPIVTIPNELLRTLNCDWDIDWRGQGVGSANGGNTQVIYNRFPRWVGTPRLLLYGAELAEWRAIRAQAQGYVGIYRLPMIDPIGFNDPALLISAFVPVATANLAANAGATTITVNADVAPNPGQIMSANDWPFVVTTVSDLSGGVYELGVQMPLREAIAVDDEINMQGVGRFEAIEENMGNPAYTASRVATISLAFREVLAR